MKQSFLKLSVMVFSLSIFSATAQLYWDSNGAASGAGTTPTGTWGTDPFWSTAAAGDVPTGAWTDGSTAVFAAGTDAIGTYTVTVNGTQAPAGITFEEGAVTLSGGTLDFPSGGSLQVDAALATINSVMSGGTAQLTKLGSGTLVLGGNNTFTNTFSVVQGTLRMGASGDILPNATVSVSSGATLDLNNFSVGIGSLGVVTLSSGSSVTLGSGTLTNLGMVANSRYDGVISGTGGLVKAGTNTLTLAGLNTFTGRTVILGGVLALFTTSPNDGLGTLPGSYVADQLTLDGGVLNFPATSPTNIASTRGIYLGPSGGTITMSSSKSPGVDSNITGPGTLLKSSTGNISLNGTNTFAGDFTIRAGGVRFNSDCAAGTGKIIISPDASVFLRNLTPPGNVSTLTNAITVNAGASFVDLNAALPDLFTLSGPISGAGPMLRGQQGGASGYLVLSGDNSGWSGGLTLWRGKLALGHKNALGTGAFTIRPATNASPSTALANVATLYAWTPLTGANAVATPVTIDITNAAVHFAIAGTNALELSGPINLGTTITPAITNNNTGGTIFSGVVSGSAGIGLIKEGTNTLTLSGLNTYDGVTTINAGTLLVNSPGSLAGGSVVVNSGGTLGGSSGTINGLVTVNSGGSIGAGSSPGTLTLANGLNLAGGGTNVWELAANSTSNPGTDFDRIVLSGGSLTLGGSSTLKIVFTGTATAPDSSNPFWQSTRNWTIISATSLGSTFATIENGVWAAGTFSTSAQAGGIVLTFTPGAAPTPVTSFSITNDPGSSMTLKYSGGSGSQFVLLQTNNVAAPLSLWTRLQTNTTSPGSFTITPGTDPREFYRVKSE